MKRVRGPRSTRVVVNSGGHLASATPSVEPVTPKPLAPRSGPLSPICEAGLPYSYR